MIRFFFVFVTLFISTHYIAYTQQKLLTLTYDCNVATTAFREVSLIDNRNQSPIIGIVYKGLTNNPVEVKYNGSLTDSLALFFKNTSTTPSKSTLVLMLNEFYLNERNEGTYERGNFRLSLRLFTGDQPDRFADLLTIDTTYTVEGLDVTNKLLRSVSQQFCAIAEQASILQRNQHSNQPIYYSLQDLQSLDSLEKSKLPIYQTDTYPAGVYKNYNQFKNNSPEIRGEVLIEEDKRGIQVYVWNEQKKKKVKLVSTDLYVVSDGNTLVKGTALGFHKIVKENSDFYYWRPFINYSHSSFYYLPIYNPAGGILGGMIAGAISGALTAAILNTPGTKNKWVLQKINYRRGNAIPVAWVSQKSE